MGNIAKTKDGYGYKYADLAQTNEYLESIGYTYYQYIETFNGDDYIITVPIKDGKELPPRRGCKVVEATLSGKSNPAQEQGSAITYARRYSLWMAFGLATEDDDGNALTQKNEDRIAKARAKLDEFIAIHDVRVDVLCRVFKVASIDEMSAPTMERALKWLKACKEKKEVDVNE